ncbi:DNA-binding protein [Bradyrhizobium sp. STM 3557]|uniref:DNA-binding protein n=1 Tax=Bradyrhizobium sp. STM 3557 TaxID=578920 RepID=UPI00388F71C3
MNNIADDLLEGVKSISRFIGTTERRTFYLAEKGELPGVFKQGNRWVGLKSKIREGYERRAAGTEAA